MPDTPERLDNGRVTLPRSEYVTAEEARTLLMGPHHTQPIPSVTIYAWMRRGVRGSVLVSLPFGGRRIIERAEIDRFKRHLMGQPEPEQAPES